MTNVLEFQQFKTAHRKISLVTAYDAWSARLVAASGVDAILVGDSAAMVVHGHETTIPATTALMALHTRAVARACRDKFVVSDLPFLACRKGLRPAMAAVAALLRSGAHAVKAEGLAGHARVIRHIVESGVPVMGHLGLTPQAVRGLGGFRVQGRNDQAAAAVLRDAHALEDLGCFAIVLECVPADLARQITAELRIPTIGIGAGPHTDGQVLVLQDLLGLNPDCAPRFVRRYLDGERLLTQALNAYDADVKGCRFPAPSESYT